MHGDIPIGSVIKVVSRTVAVRGCTVAYGGAELKIVGFVRSRNNYFQLYRNVFFAY